MDDREALKAELLAELKAEIEKIIQAEFEVLEVAVVDRLDSILEWEQQQADHRAELLEGLRTEGW